MRSSSWKDFFLLLVSTIAAASANQCGIKGRCKEGLLLDLILTDSPDNCIIQGRRIDGAKFVSWTPAGDCEVYADCPGLDIETADAVTSSVHCKVCHAPGLCSGNVIISDIVSGEEECEHLCLETPTCAWFTFLVLNLPDQKECLIYEDCTALNTACTHCSTSMHDCLQDSPSVKNKMFYIDGSTGKSTLVSLDGRSGNCELSDYPAPSHFPAVVAYLDTLGAAAACGGYALADSSTCWMFNGISWQPLVDSNQHHCMADSPNLVVEEGWWVTGRNQSGDDYCPFEWTSEIFTGEEWVPGPRHPQNYSVYSCIVNLNSTHTLYTGGDPTWSDAYLFDWIVGEWTPTGSLNAGRLLHGCVDMGAEGVLLAGGTKDGYLYSVELYDPVKGIWSKQPDLPMDISNPSDMALFNWQGNVIALFRGKDQIYQRRFDTGEWDVLEGVQLPVPFGGSVSDRVTLVPDDLVMSCP